MYEQLKRAFIIQNRPNLTPRQKAKPLGWIKKLGRWSKALSPITDMSLWSKHL